MNLYPMERTLSTGCAAPGECQSIAGPGPGQYIARMSHDHSHSEPSGLADFQAFRSQMNEAIFAHGNLTINRFFALDGRAYEEGALGTRTKELMGLVASLVLRCDDCITYHVAGACQAGATDDELMETFAIGLIVGGSIVIPHLRRAVARLAEVRAATGPAAD